MKTLISIAAAILLTSISFSQGVAPNWSLTDCSGNPHTLYNYLDSQEVVVMEFSMGCITCQQGANRLMEIKQWSDVAYPGKVNYFYMDYWDTNSCSYVNGQIASYDFDAGFAGCEDQKNDYYAPNVYPMPATIIAAGNHHHVIFQRIGWLDSDTSVIKQEIIDFFNTISIEDNQELEFAVFPNPSDNYLNLQLLNETADSYHFEICDLQGRVVMNGDFENDHDPINVSNLTTGSYIITISNKKGHFHKRFLKQ